MTAGGAQFRPAGAAPARASGIPGGVFAKLTAARFELECLAEFVNATNSTMTPADHRWLCDETARLEGLARAIADQAEGGRADYEARAHAAVLQAARGLMGGAR